ncbi:outer membrane lipoprotein carrier protein LolA [Thermodesulfobacteriota bacterium]
MHTFLKTIVVITAFLCIGWADTWDGIKEAAKKVSSVSAEFVQEKHLEILVRPFVSKGVFYFQAPNSLRWEYRSPIESILLMHDGKTRRYIKRNGEIAEDAGVHLQSMQVVLRDITRWLNGRFDENPAFSASIESDRKIVLRPKEKSLATMIQRIELILSDRPGIIEAVMIYEGENSYTRFEFRNVILNQVLQDSIFRKIS